MRLLPVHPLYLHAKLIVGQKLAYIGSQNLTETSLEKNRELGLLLQGSVVKQLQQKFNQDWSSAGGGGGILSKVKRFFQRI